MVLDTAALGLAGGSGAVGETEVTRMVAPLQSNGITGAGRIAPAPGRSVAQHGYHSRGTTRRAGRRGAGARKRTDMARGAQTCEST